MCTGNSSVNHTTVNNEMTTSCQKNQQYIKEEETFDLGLEDKEYLNREAILMIGQRKERALGQGRQDE